MRTRCKLRKKRNPLALVETLYLGLNDDPRGGSSSRPTSQLGEHLARDIAINSRVIPIRRGRNHRQTGVRFFADAHVQRNLTEKRHAETLRFFVSPAMTEDVRPRAAGRTKEVTHVLHDTEDGHIHPFEHGDAPPSIDERKVLWRGNYHRALHGNLLSHCKSR